MYHAGARAAGFDKDRWTTSIFATAILNKFGVHYDPDHAGRIMHRLGLREKTRHVRRTQVTAFPQVPAADLPRAGVA